MTGKLNRAVRCTAAVLAVIAVGAGASACDSSSGTKASSSAAQDSSATGQDTAKDSAPATGKKLAQQGSRTDAVNTLSNGASSSSSSATERCHTGALNFSFGGPHGGRPDMDTTQQQSVSVKLENAGDVTCTLHGFPGVTLVNADGDTWDLRRSGVTPSTLTLKPGEDTAMVSMSILPVDPSDKDTKPFVPSKVLITPPNETTHVDLDWPYGGAILDQSGATRPGTFVDPIVIG
ncbi:DUF4232 domain-containing protein [Streptomyces tsukubensis]|uniref:DUF4232 domain-containing protein n=1 Tax=Streptomyces tsukubensis TaxID=83656 RepID=A0A1V4A335_9ACTN|nr:DUF4232 domain-containing protein [Streptomyces tsukubensis]OON74358.1 hypothetical protein B1H18_24970 [Streptomyces tsukubensis]QFR95405.1 DUF4232 domain-containing protein [Streptomyces tsukubensis]